MATGTIEQRTLTGLVPDEPLFEIVNGERLEIPRMGALAGSVASFLAHWLNSFALPRKLGFAVTEVLLNLGVGRNQRRPDVSFIRWERWPYAAGVFEDPPVWDVVPNAAAEVVSPSNTANEIEDKIVEYFAAGVQLVWVIYPLLQRVYVYRSPNEATILEFADELDGGDVLPGFKVKIAELFAAARGPA